MVTLAPRFGVQVWQLVASVIPPASFGCKGQTERSARWRQSRAQHQSVSSVSPELPPNAAVEQITFLAICNLPRAARPSVCASGAAHTACARKKVRDVLSQLHSASAPGTSTTASCKAMSARRASQAAA